MYTDLSAPPEHRVPMLHLPQSSMSISLFTGELFHPRSTASSVPSARPIQLNAPSIILFLTPNSAQIWPWPEPATTICSFISPDQLRRLLTPAARALRPAPHTVQIPPSRTHRSSPCCPPRSIQPRHSVRRQLLPHRQPPSIDLRFARSPHHVEPAAIPRASDARTHQQSGAPTDPSTPLLHSPRTPQAAHPTHPSTPLPSCPARSDGEQRPTISSRSDGHDPSDAPASHRPTPIQLRRRHDRTQHQWPTSTQNSILPAQIHEQQPIFLFFF
ncbi:hypothetical protein ACLOJK_028503 [Asimina triloba]